MLCAPCYSEEPLTTDSDVYRGVGYQFLKNTIANNPNSKIAKICCARVHLQNGDVQEAKDLIMAVLKQDPSNKSANSLLKTINGESTVIYSEEVDTTVNEIPECSTLQQDSKFSSIVNTETDKPKTSAESKTLPVEEKESKSESEEPKELDIIASDSTENISNGNSISVPDFDPNSSDVFVIDSDFGNGDDDIQSKNTIKDSDTSKNSEVISEKEMVFKPYIAGTKDSHTHVHADGEYKSNIKYDVNDIPTPTDLTKKSFLKACERSFTCNLEEAIFRIEKNDLKSAEELLNVAGILSVDTKDSKKVANVQLMRSVLFVYQCEFEKFGKHLMGLRGGIPDELYESLLSIYKESTTKKTKYEKQLFAAQTALNSEHYRVALDIAQNTKHVNPETDRIIAQSSKALAGLDGENLLVKGSYLAALDYFEKNNQLAEQGRTYLALSKTLDGAGESKYAAVAEKFGEECLFKNLKKAPNDPKTNLYLALYFADKNRKDDAQAAIKRGLASANIDELVKKKLEKLGEAI